MFTKMDPMSDGELETHNMNMTINTNAKNDGEHKNIKT